MIAISLIGLILHDETWFELIGPNRPVFTKHAYISFYQYHLRTAFSSKSRYFFMDRLHTRRTRSAKTQKKYHPD